MLFSPDLGLACSQSVLTGKTVWMDFAFSIWFRPSLISDFKEVCVGRTHLVHCEHFIDVERWWQLKSQGHRMEGAEASAEHIGGGQVRPENCWVPGVSWAALLVEAGHTRWQAGQGRHLEKADKLRAYKDIASTSRLFLLYLTPFLRLFTGPWLCFSPSPQVPLLLVLAHLAVAPCGHPLPHVPGPHPAGWLGAHARFQAAVLRVRHGASGRVKHAGGEHREPGGQPHHQPPRAVLRWAWWPVPHPRGQPPRYPAASRRVLWGLPGGHRALEAQREAAGGGGDHLHLLPGTQPH